MDVEYHITSVVFECGVWVSGRVVEKLHACVHSGFGALRLVCRDGAESYEHGVVDCPGIIEEDAYYFAYAFDVFVV